MVCSFCEKEPKEHYFGSYCKECRELKNIMNVYGHKKVLEIVKFCCLRNDQQIQNKKDIELRPPKINIDKKVCFKETLLRGGKKI